MKKSKPIQVRSQVALAMNLRGGDGIHGDRRTKRNRTRSTQKSNAIREQM